MRRKIYIVLTLLVYLVGIVYAGFGWHFHLNLGEKQFAEHKCIGHKSHPDLKSDLGCIVSFLNLSHIFVEGYNLRAITSGNPFFLKDLLCFELSPYLFISSRAPPIS